MTHTKTLQQMVRTEIGSFPPDWPIRRLDQIAGGVSVGLVINPSTYFSERGTVPMLLGSQVTPNKIDHGAAKRITSQSNTKIPASILRAGDLITVRVGDPGTTAVIPDELDGCNCASMMIIRRAPSFNSAWLSHLLNSPVGSRQVANVQYGTAQKQFNIGDAVGFLFPVPPKSEQDAISKALSDTDTLIDSLEQLLTKKRQIKQGAMQELLTGKRRLPGFSGEWADCTLLQLADIRSGGTPSTRQADFWDGGIPWCTPTDITALAGAKHIVDTERSISEKGQKASSAEMLPIGTVVMTSRATIGECAIAAVPLTTNQGFKNFIPRSTTCGDFLYYLLGTQRSAFLALCSGSTFLEIGKRQLAEFSVRCPIEYDEQRAIADVLSSIDAEIVALESRLTKARALKQAMAQALLTGRIRLVSAAAASASAPPN